MPMPSRADERWRRTDISKPDLARIRPLSVGAREEAVRGFPSPADSPPRGARVREGLLSQGVVCAPFGEGLRVRADLFGPYVARGVGGPKQTVARRVGGIPADANKFEVLTRALGTD